MPTMLLVGAVGFIAAAQDVSTVVLLSTTGTRPLSLLQLDLLAQGDDEGAAGRRDRRAANDGSGSGGEAGRASGWNSGIDRDGI